MRREQLKNSLEKLLHELVHFKTVSFSYRSDDGKVHSVHNYMNIYLGFKKSEIKNIAWVSENIRGTAYVKNSLCYMPKYREISSKKRQVLWDEAERLILEYANTPLNKRHNEYVVAVGQNRDMTLAVYSKDSHHITTVTPKMVRHQSCYRFSQKEFNKLYDFLSPTFKKIALKGKTPVSKFKTLLQ